MSRKLDELMQCIQIPPESLEQIAFENGVLIPLPDNLNLHTLSRKKLSAILLPIICRFYPNSEFLDPSITLCRFVSEDVVYRCTYRSQGIYIRKDRADSAYLMDEVVGDHNSEEEAVVATMDYLGGGAGFMGFYFRNTSGKPNRKYALFCQGERYYYGIRNGDSYGVKSVAPAPSKPLHMRNRAFYWNVNYPNHADHQPEVPMRQVLYRNKVAKAILPIDVIYVLEGVIV